MHPVLFKINDYFIIDSYFTCITIAIIIGILYTIKRSQHFNIDIPNILDFLTVFIISIYLGSRLYHVVFEELAFYIKNPLKILFVWQGGFSITGGIILAILSTIIFCKIKKIKVICLLNLIIQPFLISYSIGRLGCFLTGCCYGKITNSFIGVSFPPNSAAHPHNIPLHPTQLYLSGSSLLIFLLIIILEKLYPKIKHFYSFYIGLLLLSVARFIIEFFRNDERGYFFLSLSSHQWASILIITIIIVYMMISKKDKMMVG